MPSKIRLRPAVEYREIPNASSSLWGRGKPLKPRYCSAKGCNNLVTEWNPICKNHLPRFHHEVG